MSLDILTSAVGLFGRGLRAIRILATIAAILLLIITGTFIGTYFYFAKELPDTNTIKDYVPPVLSAAYSSDGTKIGEFWEECRIYIPFEQIPKQIMQAFIDSEDARFFEHKGVDIRSIFRAFLANFKAGSVSQGGSTITQQITRSLLLSRERTITRKIKEAILATRIERELSKKQIITLYLNHIYLGNRAYGIGAAARNYFHKNVEDLSLAEIALIAGLPTAPTNFSPVVNPTEARRKQHHVLGRMLDMDHITEAEAKAAFEAQFPVYVAGTDKSFNDKSAAYFTEHVRRIVKERYGDEALYNKGLKIQTTLDLRMQKAGVDAVQRAVESLDRRQGYRGAIENIPPAEIPYRAKRIGEEIFAKQHESQIQWPPIQKSARSKTFELVTGKEYKAVVVDFNGADTFIQIGDLSGIIKQDGIKWAKPFSNNWLGSEGSSYVSDPRKVLKVGDIVLVRRLEDGTFSLFQEPLIQSALVAIDPKNGHIKTLVGGYDFDKSEWNRATQSLRQPGSSFKPFVYAAALDKGYTYNTTIQDEPVSYQVGRNKSWSPKNYGGGYKGATPFRNALIFSRNIPTVKITFDIGTHYLAAYARKLGLTSPIDKYLSMALGSNGVYLLEMVQAYTVFANAGEFNRAIAITKIEDAGGNILEEALPPKDSDAEIIAAADTETANESSVEGEDLLSTELLKRQLDKADLNISLLRDQLNATKGDGLFLTDLEMKTLYGSNISNRHVITPQTAYLMVNLMKGVVEGGTGQRVKALGKPVAGKTGTTNDETDTWFIGYTPYLAAGVWVGFDEVKPIGKGAQGGNTSAPLFLDFMKVATEGWEPIDFTKPDNFPTQDISSLSGGSAVFGSRPSQQLFYSAPRSEDRAGEFFEQDLEDSL